MSNTTWARVVAYAPELSTLTEDQQSMVVEDAISLVSLAFGDKQEFAQRCLAAHFGTVLQASSKNTVGPAQSKTVGSVSVSYASLSVADMNRYDATAYGRQYLEIRNSTVLGFRVVAPG